MTLRRTAGWIAVGVSTAFSMLWAFWGSIEAFHEGWFSRTWTRNLLGAIAYLIPMLALMIPALVAIRWPRIGAALHAAIGATAAWIFELYDRPAILAILTIPLCAVAALYLYGRAEPRKWAIRLIAGLPLATAVVSGAYPCWLAVSRQDDGDYGLRIIEGNGVRLAWAPQGPGWPEEVANWNEATVTCERLSRNGLRREATPQRIWRLPTVDEAVRSAVRRGINAGGTWDPRHRQAHYRVPPNKETPLWTRYSPAMYRWTGTEADSLRAYRFVWNGIANALPKTVRIHFRCVAEVSAVVGVSSQPAGMTRRP